VNDIVAAVALEATDAVPVGSDLAIERTTCRRLGAALVSG
jgi:hypothetical protein